MTKPPLLLIQPSVGIGDLIWTKPWLDAIIAERKTVLMAKPSSMPEIIMAEHENLQIIHAGRGSRGVRGNHDGVGGFFRMARAMRETGAGEAWILHRSWRYAAAAMIAGIGLRSGYGLGDQCLFLNDMRGLPWDLKGAHPRIVAAAFTEAMGISVPDTHPRIRVSAEEMRAVSRDAKKPLIVFGVGASTEDRHWAPENFARLIDMLCRDEKFAGYEFALCGSRDEEAIGRDILRRIAPATPPPRLVFDRSLREVIAFFALARYYIGNDTGLLNIAAAVNTPCVRIFASNLPVLESPLVADVPLPDPARRGVMGAINDIPVESVMEVFRVHYVKSRGEG